MNLTLHKVAALSVTHEQSGSTQWLSLTGESGGHPFEVVLFCDDAKALLLPAIKPHADLIALDHIASMVGK